MSYAQRWLLATAVLGQGDVQGEHVYMLNISSGGKPEPEENWHGLLETMALVCLMLFAMAQHCLHAIRSCDNQGHIVYQWYVLHRPTR